MNQHAFGAYLVVKILSKDRNDLEKYVCIPNSWVKVKDNYDNTVVFGYPSIEDRLDTRLRVIEYQPLDKKWSTIFGEVIFHTDSQEDAFRFLETKTEHTNNIHGQSKDTNEQDAQAEKLAPSSIIRKNSTNQPKRKPGRPRKRKPSNQESMPQSNKTGNELVKNVESEILEAQELIHGQAEKLAPASTITIKSTNQPKRKPGRPRKRKPSDQESMPQSNKNGNELETNLESEILEAQELIRKYASDDEGAVFHSTPKSSHNDETADTTEIFPKETDTDIALEKTPVNNKRAKKITQQPRRKSIRLTKNVSKSYSEFSDEDCDNSDVIEYAPKIIRPEPPKSSGQSVVAQDHVIDINLLNDHVYSECYNFYVEFNESYQKSMSILDNAEDYLQNLISKHNDNIAAKAKLLSPSPTYEQPDVISPTMFSHPQPLLEERSNISIEDTKWTLRYPEPGPGIIELIPNTGVYVSERGLNECKSIHNETTKFTRGLLEEVFTDEALKICSFTGQSRKKTGKKFALDQKARETYFNYVLRYSLKMGWDKADPEIIMNCIRNRLQTLGRSG